jgi:DNA integrity scanning protein DisA with diadenylate cyclase activity
MEFASVVAKKALEIAEAIEANAIIVLTETGEAFELIAKKKPKITIIAATANDETYQSLLKESMITSLKSIVFVDMEEDEDIARREKGGVYAIRLLTRSTSIAAQIEDTVIVGLHKGILNEDDVVVVIGSDLTSEANMIIIYEIKKEKLGFTLYDLIRESNVKHEVFESTLNIALEIGREGRGGKQIGTAFLLGDSQRVLEKSKQLILNPFAGHLIGERMITDPAIAETVKELAQLDGVFVISEDGVIEAAGRYLTVDTSEVDIPRGLGTRHAAVAAMTAATDAIGITVSESGGVVRIFKKGEIVLTIEPQRRISLISESLRHVIKAR